MSNRISSNTAPSVQTAPAVPADESKPDGGEGSKPPAALSSGKDTTGPAARKQGKETTSLNQLHEGIHQKDLQKKLPSSSTAEKGKSNGVGPQKPESLGTYADAVKEAEIHGKIVKKLEDRLKNAPDSEKASIQTFLDVEKRMLDHARWKMEVLRPPKPRPLTREEEEERQRMLKLLQNLRG